MRMTQRASQDVLKEHYKEHAQRKFYQELIDSMSSGPIVIIHLRGSKAVARIRKMLGGTDPSAAEPGSLRGTFGIDKTNNFMVPPYVGPAACLPRRVCFALVRPETSCCHHAGLVVDLCIFWACPFLPVQDRRMACTSLFAY
jgi:nucleoside diphosphate kinase